MKRGTLCIGCWREIHGDEVPARFIGELSEAELVCSRCGGSCREMPGIFVWWPFEPSEKGAPPS
jgi:hypothetical protein